MAKSISNIDRSRLQRFFLGTHDMTNPKAEMWYEIGHFYEGVSLRPIRLSEKDGLGRENPDNMGFEMDGSAQPAQNTIEEYRMMNSLMNGTRNVAVLVGKRLQLYRIVEVKPGDFSDNRIAIVTSGIYDDHVDKAETKFSGWIPFYERLLVEDFQLVNNKLAYKVVKSTFVALTSEPTVYTIPNNRA